MNLFSKKREIKTSQLALLFITGLVLGFLVITQAKYFNSYVTSISRDSTENVFRRIQILKTSNDELKDEITTLENQLAELNDQAQSFATIDKEIKKNEILAGDADVFGPGIELVIENDLNSVWFTDLTNELIASGAETISINGIRLTDSTVGFDALPNGQIMVNGVILRAPYTFQIIGDKDALEQILANQVGIINKMGATFQDFKYTLTKKDRIDMKKV